MICGTSFSTLPFWCCATLYHLSLLLVLASPRRGSSRFEWIRVDSSRFEGFHNGIVSSIHPYVRITTVSPPYHHRREGAVLFYSSSFSM
jgi:hypothetical protein